MTYTSNPNGRPGARKSVTTNTSRANAHHKHPSPHRILTYAMAKSYQRNARKNTGKATASQTESHSHTQGQLQPDP
jgi:hypothetical protein